MSTLSVERMDVPDQWGESQEVLLAEEEGMELEEGHWGVIYFQREHCREQGA